MYRTLELFLANLVVTNWISPIKETVSTLPAAVKFAENTNESLENVFPRGTRDWSTHRTIRALRWFNPGGAGAVFHPEESSKLAS